MAYQEIGLGTSAADGTGDTIRAGGDKINDNFVELYTLLGTGTALSSGISATATVVTLTAPTISGVVGGTQTSATITTVNATTVNSGTLALAAGSITDSSGAISFGNENLTTTGTITGTLASAAQTSITSLGTLTALVVDDISLNGKVIIMTGDTDDTVTFTTAANGTLSIVTVDTAGAAGNIQVTADGTVDIDSAGVLTLDSGAAINIEPAAGSSILLDGTISIDAGVVTGATSITSDSFNLPITLNGTDGSSTDAGDNITLNGTDGSSTDENDRIVYEDATRTHYEADILKADVDNVLTGGFGGTDADDGIKASSGTYTPTYVGGNFKLAVNGGAHTLAPQSGTGTIIIQYTNNAAAGTITTSGWTIVTGDDLTTTDAEDFMFYLTVVAAFKHLHVVALQ